MIKMILISATMGTMLFAYETYGCAAVSITNLNTGAYIDNRNDKEIYINVKENKAVTYEHKGQLYVLNYQSREKHPSGAFFDVYLIGKTSVLAIFNNFKNGVKVLTEKNSIETLYNPCFKLSMEDTTN